MLINRLRHYWVKTSTKRYITYLKKCGVKIGKNFCIRNNIKSIEIDLTRPSLITIGDNVTVNKNFSLYTHDFVSGIFIHKYSEFIPSSGKVTIGNNVRFGINCTVLRGVTIGDNCFIAAGSVVTKNIPANSLAGGVPAKVICSIDDYYTKRKELCIEEAFEYARSIKERFGRQPVASDFWEEFPLFVDSNNISDYPNIPIRQQLGENFNIWIQNHKAQYNGINDFLTAAKL